MLPLRKLSININNAQIPSGGVTTVGLVQNIKAGILFIHSWLRHGNGQFVLDGAIEDSATAEISRSQVWQWLYHQVRECFFCFSGLFVI